MIPSGPHALVVPNVCNILNTSTSVSNVITLQYTAFHQDSPEVVSLVHSPMLVEGRIG